MVHSSLNQKLLRQLVTSKQLKRQSYLQKKVKNEYQKKPVEAKKENDFDDSFSDDDIEEDQQKKQQGKHKHRNERQEINDRNFYRYAWSEYFK